MSTMIIGSTTVRLSISSRVALGWKRFRDTMAAWRNRLHSRRELASLDEATLRDIGMSRGAVKDEVSKPFWMP